MCHFFGKHEEPQGGSKRGNGYVKNWTYRQKWDASRDHFLDFLGQNCGGNITRSGQSPTQKIAKIWICNGSRSPVFPHDPPVAPHVYLFYTVKPITGSNKEFLKFFNRLAHEQGFHPTNEHERWYHVKSDDIARYKVREKFSEAFYGKNKQTNFLLYILDRWSKKYNCIEIE